MNVKKVLIGTAIAAVVGYLIYKGTQKTFEAKAFVDQLNFNIKLGKIAIQNKKLVIKLNIEFINPTKLSVSFEKPTVQIKYNGSVLAQSKISKDIVTIKPQGMSVLKDMTFEIPILSLLYRHTLLIHPECDETCIFPLGFLRLGRRFPRRL